ncbi:hypothetical protein RhiirC2_796088 [Rhizophagus irregularis]|uniref:Uncharacterized protein n=1 Tax=Rhizophagus irregularis TaxID=588596 RepID=A0A2N1MAC9_9GLOM|nr:hypothetical protein RhiirC2_796088 [Rhizophagus irregularis]
MRQVRHRVSTPFQLFSVVRKTYVDHLSLSYDMKIPDVKTSAKNSQKGKKSSDSEATQILTGYEAVREEQEQI